MDIPIVTRELAERIEQYETEAHLSRVAGMMNVPGNPLAVEMKVFGGATAFIVRGAPYLEVTRVLNLGPDDSDYVEPLLNWFIDQDTVPQVDISPHVYTEDFLRKLAQNGLYQGRFLSVMYGLPVQGTPPLPVGITVREFSNNEVDDFAAFVTEIQEIAPQDRPLWQQVYKAQCNDWRRYIAFIGGKPAGHGIMRVHGNVAVLMFAATKPALRGYGAQTALLRQRVADAAAAQCDLVISSSNPGSVSQRNQERAGMRVAYTKAIWTTLHKD